MYYYEGEPPKTAYNPPAPLTPRVRYQEEPVDYPNEAEEELVIEHVAPPKQLTPRATATTPQSPSRVQATPRPPPQQQQYINRGGEDEYYYEEPKKKPPKVERKQQEFINRGAGGPLNDWPNEFEYGFCNCVEDFRLTALACFFLPW
jgi:hypothetical protein